MIRLFALIFLTLTGCCTVDGFQRTCFITTHQEN